LNEQGYVIYPGKVSEADCFRIGSIGRIFPADIHALLAAIRSTLEDMEVDLSENKHPVEREGLKI
jgi:aspartate aminotransferase-like enzyme